MMKHVIISLFAMAAVGFFFRFAVRRRPSEVVGRKPKRLESFSVAVPKERAAERLRAGAAKFGYKIEETADTGADILLSDGATAFSFGFFYPIYLTAEGLGHTRVEVGIRSKAFQWGPVVGKHHRQCVERLKGGVG